MDLGQGFHLLPIGSRGRSVSVNIHGFNFCHVDQGQHAEVEQEVHASAAQPNHVGDVGHGVVVAASLGHCGVKGQGQ